MYKRVLIFGVVIIGLATAVVRAQDYAAVATSKNLTANIKGTAAAPVASPCATVGYAAFCPSPVVCSCLKITGASVSGSLAGKGTANLLLTQETSLATTNVAGGTCTPFFGTAALTTMLNKASKTETLNLQGVSCDGGAFAGGFGIAPSPVPSPAAAGWGALFGSTKGGVVSLQLKGSITQ
jgi:hypothetical protein